MVKSTSNGHGDNEFELMTRHSMNVGNLISIERQFGLMIYYIEPKGDQYCQSGIWPGVPKKMTCKCMDKPYYHFKCNECWLKEQQAEAASIRGQWMCPECLCVREEFYMDMCAGCYIVIKGEPW